jgi:uncharacterized protein involved in type VI secretion and phage assembly
MTATSNKADPIVIGVVKDLEDPKKLGRVRVAFPHLRGKRSGWARLATLLAGPGRGSLFRPELEDEVLVALLQGDPSQAYVVGALWNEDDTPPENGGTKENDLRTLKSRSGHVLRMNDKAGETCFEFIGAKNTIRLQILPDQDLLLLEADSGKIRINAKQGDVEVESGGSVSIQAKGDISLTAAGNVTIKGSNVLIN